MLPVSNHPSIETPPLSVVMPAYNEEKTIIECLTHVLAQPLVHEVIVVDDCSSDRTWEVVQAFQATQPRVRLERHAVNQGKGAALRTGFLLCTGDVIMIQGSFGSQVGNRPCWRGGGLRAEWA